MAPAQRRDGQDGGGALPGDKHRHLRDIVCDELRSQIIRGDLTAGTRLVEWQVAENLHVSRNPVREALRILETEGFVEVLPRRGAIVAPMSGKEVHDVFEIRVALEALAAKLAARNATPEQIGELQDIVERGQKAVADDAADAVTALNTEFHALVLQSTGNRELQLLMQPLQGRMARIFRAGLLAARASESLDEHASLVEAIAARDEARAEKLGAAHVERAQSWFAATDAIH